MTNAVTPAVPQATAIMVKAPPPSPHGGFRTFLSELNPLQYLPVLGTIYRAVTGDVIPETAREVGSLVVSGLTGGPVGVAINLGALAAEKVTGVDPEAWGAQALAAIGIGHAAQSAASPQPAAGSPNPAATTAAATAATRPAVAAHAPQAATAWSNAQLSAYGVTTGSAGDLHRGVLSGADVLNDLELARHSQDNIA